MPQHRLHRPHRPVRDPAAFPEVKRLVNAEADVAKIRDQAYKEGMKPLRISGAMKVAMGLTTFEEVLKVAPPPGKA